MFASAERVGREVGAATKIGTGFGAANGDAVGWVPFGLRQQVVRKQRLRARIFQRVRLIASELTAQHPLPISRIHPGGHSRV